MRRRRAHAALLAAALLAAAGACGEEAADNGDAPGLPQQQGGSGGSAAGSGGSGGVGAFPSAGSAGAPALLELKLEAEPWNAGNVETGVVAAVVEHEGRTVLFGDLGVRVLAGGALAEQDPSVKSWRAAALIPAADGPGAWVAGLDGQGKLHRLVNLASLEPISDRYGLASEEILALAADTSAVAFALSTGVAVASGETVDRFALGAVSAVAVRGKQVAAVLPSTVVLLDVSKKNGVSFDLQGATFTYLDGDGKLFVLTPTALLGQERAGDSEPLRELHAGSGLSGLVEAGGRLWFREGGELGTYLAGSVARTSGLKLSSGALAAASSGGVWALGGGEPQRFALGGASPDEKQWQVAVQPAFARACSKCHLPGGTGGKDLSTYASWVALRKTINSRVVVKKDMPPAGNPMTDEDRDAVAAWCAATP
jgi:mono/diheme cytochrome c family protein